jgi:hypothetical protein
VLRAVALFASFAASDDVHRYAWEGEVILSGTSPYACSPDAPELEALRASKPALFARVAHADVAAAYPPLAQATFVVASVAARAFADANAAELALKLLATTWDLLALAALAALLRRRGLPGSMCIVWAWSPLVALEFAGSGHFDALGIGLWLAALAFAQASNVRGTLLSSLCVALAALVKCLPICSVPFVLRGRGGWRGALVVASTLVLAGLPFLALEWPGSGWFSGPLRYGFWWESTNLLYRVIAYPVRLVLGDGSGLNPDVVARVAVLELWFAAGYWMWAKRCDAPRAAFALTGLFLLLSPTLHPWYVTWIVPFLAFERCRAAHWLVVAAPLLYVLLPRWASEGVWSEPAWLWPVVALPLLGLLAFDVRAWLRREPAR